MFMEAMSVIASHWESLTWPFIRKWIKKFGYIFSACIYRLQSYAVMSYMEINRPNCLSMQLIQGTGAQGSMAS